MNLEQRAKSQAPAGRASLRARLRLGGRARGLMRRAVPPYARYSARQASMVAAIAALEGDLEHLRKRHSEQIERLETLAGELVLAAEALRRDIGDLQAASGRKRQPAPTDGSES